MVEASKRPLTIGLLAGEASGDNLGAGLMQALKARLHDRAVTFVGMGGPGMRAQGLEPLADFSMLSINGFKEPVLRLPQLYRLYRSLANTMIARQVDVFVGIDFNVFNLLLEGRLKRAGVPTAHYVSPSVYAWRRGRTRKIARCADKILCLFPFEPEFYRGLDVQAHFVGHPLAAEIAPATAGGEGRAQALQSLGLDDRAVTLALLPGSRGSEVELMLPSMLAAAQGLASQLRAQGKNLQVVIPCLNSARAAQIQELGAEVKGLEVRYFLGDARVPLVACDLALVKSGTSTLEAMLLGKPMVVTYRLNRLSYWIARLLVSTEHVAIPNILAGRMLVPELLQDAATPQALCEALMEQWSDNVAQQKIQAVYGDIHRQLAAGDSGDGASMGAARAVLELVPAAKSSQ